MSKPSSGLFHGTSGSHASASEKRNQALATVKKLIAETPGGKKKAMAVGAYDSKTGKNVAAFAGEIPKRIHPELRKRAEKIGGIGTHGLTSRNTVGVCAEFHAVNSLLLSGCKWSDIRLTPAIRPRTGTIMPYCDNCLAMFDDLIRD